MKDKVVVITGAGSGIGAAAAKLFAQEGAKVVISDINEVKAQSIVQEIQQTGGTAKAIICDVGNYEQVGQLIQQTVKLYGRLDVMVNNAGIANRIPAKTDQHTLDDWDNVIAVNQTGVFYCMKLALQQMLIQEDGNIVNVASLAGLKASGNNLAYSASKFAVVGMTKSAALEYGRKNIRINAVCPGYTDTPLVDEALLSGSEHMKEKLLAFVPMKRFGKVEEIAEAILWLASDKTSFITGQTITLDGGLSL